LNVGSERSSIRATGDISYTVQLMTR
jgi:hypothetical protein